MEFKQLYPAPSEESVQEIETIIGESLPDQYRSLMLQYNGGRPPIGNVFDFKSRLGPDGDGDLQFYAIDGGSGLDLMSSRYAMKGRVPDDCLPIAGTATGNEIVIGLFGERRGKIFFYDLDDGPLEHEDPLSSFYHLADSLHEFFRMLYEFNPDEPDGVPSPRRYFIE